MLYLMHVWYNDDVNAIDPVQYHHLRASHIFFIIHTTHHHAAGLTGGLAAPFVAAGATAVFGTGYVHVLCICADSIVVLTYLIGADSLHFQRSRRCVAGDIWHCVWRGWRRTDGIQAEQADWGPHRLQFHTSAQGRVRDDMFDTINEFTYLFMLF